MSFEDIGRQVSEDLMTAKKNIRKHVTEGGSIFSKKGLEEMDPDELMEGSVLERLNQIRETKPREEVESMTFEDTTRELGDAFKGSSEEISKSISSISQEVSEGIHGLMHDIALSDSEAEGDETEEATTPKAQQAAMVPMPYGYQQQAPEEAAYEPVLTRLQRLRS